MVDSVQQIKPVVESVLAKNNRFRQQPHTSPKYTPESEAMIALRLKISNKPHTGEETSVRKVHS